ncbi:DNA polymerase V [Rhodoferax ferrireducens]|uniref:DNA polymerase V n=1 Tax=Rhodoferax ferrireducens TaxID=192843 RepID=A0ABU2CGG5_9BURK|nr:translesion error-prone DNA polymerase V autoproteolytic subunit [Rhodoferax ferrireducens]MDR7380442.1 DNA polymerase V [Rhodoferax ferrireducens]
MHSISIPIGLPVELSSLSLVLPLAGDVVHAGFPSPALDFPGERIDLIKTLVTHPQATFLLRVSGDSMRDAGIFDDDVLVVNRALRPRHGHVVVAQVDGDFTVKYLYQRGGRVKLRAANVTFPDIIPGDGQTLEVFGVVTSCIKQFKV